MTKINHIIALRILKITFYLLIIFSLASSLFIGISAFINPQQPVVGTSFSIGSYESDIVSNYNFGNFYIRWPIVTFYILSVFFYICSIAIYFVIKYKFKFNYQKFNKLGLIQLVLFAILFILISIISFDFPHLVNKSYNIDTNGYKNINCIFDYSITERVLTFKYSASGIAIIFFFVLEIFLIFICWLIFSYKIIKNKYV